MPLFNAERSYFCESSIDVFQIFREVSGVYQNFQLCEHRNRKDSTKSETRHFHSSMARLQSAPHPFANQPQPPIGPSANASGKGVSTNSRSAEIERVLQRTRGWTWQRSHAWAQLTLAYGPKVTQEELVSLAELISRQLRIRLDRDARRRKSVMIMWFEENWWQIWPWLRYLTLGP
jgi:hypothetical protein